MERSGEPWKYRQELIRRRGPRLLGMQRKHGPLKDKDQEAEFEPAVTQSAGCGGAEGGTVLAWWVSSFQGPPGTVVHFQVPPHVTALCIRVNT
ncbi:hypothetical protein FQN60_001240 [Etheostoma spectabile]|uniref:Uncharacterized protein n=1 Tax=Etheostoma spectabile TaxID=54343 RepID=A0A5J5D5Y9_9PERO|nr:hypothetical protein FQN60_001240 [Etheostoma spectabile]